MKNVTLAQVGACPVCGRKTDRVPGGPTFCFMRYGGCGWDNITELRARDPEPGAPHEG